MTPQPHTLRRARANRDDQGFYPRRSGSALLVTLFIAGLLAAAVGTYLAMTSTGSTNVKRSIGWNAALPLAEAGVEEALSHVMKNTNSYAFDGWSLTNGAYRKQRLLGDGYYSTKIAGFPGGTVSITSTGFGAWRASSYVARTVRVTAQTPSPFIPIGLEATNIIFGGSFGADSFDSSSPLYSTGGMYDPLKATALVTIATPSQFLSLGGGSHIRGYVATGPGGTVIMSGSSFVGDETYSGRGIQAGHQTNNFTATFPPVFPPFDSSDSNVQTPTSGTVNGVNYTYVLTGGNYFITNLDSGAYGKSLYVGSNATLYVAGNIDLTRIVFSTNYVGLTNRPSLDMYVAAPSLTFTPTIVGGTPPQFWVRCLPSCTTMTLTAGTPFIGVIYAPQVNLRAQGNSALCGAIVAATFQCFGTFDFHYDSSTKNIEAKEFKILSWAEL
jgi:hypothetical protein